MLKEQYLRSRLPLHGLGAPLHLYPTLGSTNVQAAKLAAEGVPHGTLVVAEEQTAGRGRAGRSWFTPAECALALSLVLRPPVLREESLGGLTVLGALAVVEALQLLGLQASIKWPNDVLLDGKKGAGVLVESVWRGRKLDFSILGIGVNVRPASVPPEEDLDFPATCVDQVAGRRVDRHPLMLEVVAGVGRWVPYLGEQSLVAAWESCLAFKGREVVLNVPHGVMYGKIQGLTSAGELRLKTRSGDVVSVAAGEVRLRSVDRLGK